MYTSPGYPNLPASKENNSADLVFAPTLACGRFRS